MECNIGSLEKRGNSTPLLSRLEKLNDVVDKEIIENEMNMQSYEELCVKLDNVRDKRGKVEELIDRFTKSISVLQVISDERSDMSKKKIEEIVNTSLMSVFSDDPYAIRIDDYTRGRYVYSRVLCIDSKGEERTLKNTTGDGVKEVISFLMNVVIIALTRSSRFIIADEILPSISNINAEIMGQVLMDLTDSGFQFIMIEHKNKLFDVDGTYTFHLSKDDEKGLVLDSLTKLDKGVEVNVPI